MASSSSPNETPLSSAMLVASNDDLLTKILLGLPTRPLVRSKSISKHWLALITHRTFSVLRRKRLGPIPSGLFLQPLHRHLTSDYRFLPLDGSPLSVTPPFRTLSFFNDEATIVRSCNGLLLCCESCTGPGMNCYVYNPTSGRFDALRTNGFWIDGMCLAFDPSKSQNYKVIAVRDSQTEGWRIDIYSSETGSWLETGVLVSFFAHYCNFQGGVYWNGAVHWVSNERKSFYFDIDRLVLVELSLPPELERCRHREITYFGESNNHLHLVAGVFPLFSSQFDVYELEKDYSGWFVKVRVDFCSLWFRSTGPVTSDHTFGYYNFFLLQIARGETDEESFLVYNDRGKIMRYNFVHGTSKEIHSCRPGRRSRMMFGDTPKFYDYIFAFPFFECLSCVV